MASNLTRRRLIQQTGISMAAGLIAAARGRAEQTPASSPASQSTTPQVSTYNYGPKLWVRVNDRVLTCYRADPGQKYPYFYPVLGPVSGLPMTDETAMPWPHHRSLFLGCDKVNHGNYWQSELKEGQILSRGPQFEKTTSDRAVILDHCDWLKPGQNPIIEDVRRFTITVPTAGRRIIDADITLKALVDIHIEKTNHSFFSIRAARDLSPLGGGTLINNQGQTGEKETFGQVATWCGFEATRLGITESIVLMDHPKNPWAPTKWFTRDYGFISPTPFFWYENGWKLPAGQSIRVRYRVIVAKGAINPAEMNDLYRRFS